MDIEKHKIPWPYETVDNFLSEPAFLAVYDYMESLENPKRLFSNFVEAFYITGENYNCKKFFIHDNSILPKSEKNIEFVINEKQKEICEILRNTFMNYLDKIYFPYKTSFGFEFARQSNKWNYKIHADKEEKKYSFVLYVGEKGSGTKLYDKDKVFVESCEWKQNKGIGFKQNDNAFHSYDSNISDVRKTIVMNVY
jgi:hypothetical protein